MDIHDSISYLENFSKIINEWNSKFTEDRNHRWFVNFIFMSQKIKDSVRENILPIQEIIKEIKRRYSEVYEKKDINYHIEKAGSYCNHIRDCLREIMKMYLDNEDYGKIRLKWNMALPHVQKDLRDLKGRLLILRRIVS